MSDRRAAWTAVRLDDLEAIPWRGTDVTWRPLRSVLATRIAGMAAFTAERAGQDVVEGHRQADDGRGHEELYVVLRGRATFTLDGVELDAPAGTFVLVPPAVHRRAVAAEPGTAVLAVGGPPVFEPAADEWIERARAALGSDPGRARRIVDDLRAAKPDSPGVGIAEALLALGRDDRDAARELLTAVPARAPALREPLASDPDLGPVVAEIP